MGRIWVVLPILVGLAGPALAVDKTACSAGFVCASKPETVVKALQDAGYRAKLESDKQGDPSIASAANGYNFDIYFYGCEAHANCDSLEITTGFDPEPRYTAALANEWNRNKRFGYAFIDDKGAFWMRYDLSTAAGGIPAKNFADVIDWYQDRLGALRTFFDKDAKPPAPNK
jgi:Putative bacterial sensory transduction regulator